VKPVKTLLTNAHFAFSAIMACSPLLTHAQCTGGFKSVTYNQVIPGTGNDSHSIIVPQFDPAKGSLVAVTIKSVISLQYAFQLENNSQTAVTYNVGIGRNDYIGSSALVAPATNMNNILKNYGPYALAASNGISGSGPDFVSVPAMTILNNYDDIDDSITAGTAGFLGTGNVTFNYFTTTYYDLTGNYTFNFTASDVINFTVIYYYCNDVVPPAELTNFNAQLQTNSLIDVNWQTINDQEGRVYTIQKSDDGTNFNDVGNVDSYAGSDSSTYLFDYSIKSNERAKIYFRLKISDKNGNVHFSDVRSVVLNGVSNGITLYPNPASNFLNIDFNHLVSNWQIDIYSSGGTVVDRKYFSNTSLATMNFTQKLPPGIYFIRASDQHTQQNYMLSFMQQ
jgi:hypothetical protein